MGTHINCWKEDKSLNFGENNLAEAVKIIMHILLDSIILLLDVRKYKD